MNEEQSLEEAVVDVVVLAAGDDGGRNQSSSVRSWTASNLAISYCWQEPSRLGRTLRLVGIPWVGG